MNNQLPDPIEKFASGQTLLSGEAVFATSASATQITESKVAATLNDVLEGSPQHKEILALVHEKLLENKLGVTKEIGKSR